METRNNGKAQRELPRQEVITKGNANAPDTTIPFHHHFAQGKFKWKMRYGIIKNNRNAATSE